MGKWRYVPVNPHLRERLEKLTAEHGYDTIEQLIDDIISTTPEQIVQHKKALQAIEQIHKDLEGIQETFKEYIQMIENAPAAIVKEQAQMVEEVHSTYTRDIRNIINAIRDIIVEWRL